MSIFFPNLIKLGPPSLSGVKTKYYSILNEVLQFSIVTRSYHINTSMVIILIESLFADDDDGLSFLDPSVSSVSPFKIMNDYSTSSAIIYLNYTTSCKT